MLEGCAEDVLIERKLDEVLCWVETSPRNYLARICTGMGCVRIMVTECDKTASFASVWGGNSSETLRRSSWCTAESCEPVHWGS